MITLAISGCCGKMGARILCLALSDSAFRVVSILEQAGHPSVGSVISGLTVSDDTNQIAKADVLVEFTWPEATMQHLQRCVAAKKAIVIGTTGLSDEQRSVIKAAAKKIPIVCSPNMSVGVNLLFGLVQQAANKLSRGYSVTITEAHHVHKKDAPSGTAKQLAKIIESVGNQKLNDIKSIRQGEIAGNHEVCFDSAQDIITLSHSAKTRDIFAQGALVAAKFIIKKKIGLFTMIDVLGIE